MTTPQRLTMAQAKMLEEMESEALEDGEAFCIWGDSNLESAGRLRTATALQNLGLGKLAWERNGPERKEGDPPSHFVLDRPALARFRADQKEWQRRPRTSGKSGRHSESDTAVILRLDGRELARWRKLAAKKGQSFKAWARDAFLAHEGR